MTAGPAPAPFSDAPKRPLRRLVRRSAVAAAGSLVVLVGLVLVPLPGPGWATVFAGVALLGTEFRWAEQLQRAVRRRVARAAARLPWVPLGRAVATFGAAAALLTAAGVAALVL